MKGFIATTILLLSLVVLVLAILGDGDVFLGCAAIRKRIDRLVY